MTTTFLLVACASRLAVDDAVPVIPEAAAPVARFQAPGLPPVAPAPVVPPATLVSGPCGDRTYVREIDLEPGGRFTARDLVSPCPPGVLCVWSGIVTRAGTAAWREGALMLETAVPAGGPPVGPLPDRLVPAGPDALQDSAGCLYRVTPSGPR